MQLLTPEEGILAVRLARGAIEYTITKKPKPMVHLTPVFDEKRGVFVTLTKNGQLRGCIGFPYPVMPLGNAIEDAAVAAALEDPRFPGVKKEELINLDFEVTVLTVPVPLACDPDERPKHIEVGRHGLIARGLGTSGLLLPQVAPEYNWDAKTFLDHTCEKAGLPCSCWKRKDVEILIFEGQIFCGSFGGSV
ncbi:MAG: TIGR00296 family protein [Methanoregula sp.]|uniref:TIGR00296 family protein n=1 Tax=Methanoregula sp. TaxID=2052170 RepID=UPI003BAFDCBD